jgi:hypothetical protein
MWSQKQGYIISGRGNPKNGDKSIAIWGIKHIELVQKWNGSVSTTTLANVVLTFVCEYPNKLIYFSPEDNSVHIKYPL